MTDPKLYKNTYWNHKGRHERQARALATRVPASGEVTKAICNPALEKFRIASNCYYDLYNNGLCNRFVEFREVFGFHGPWVERDYDAEEYGETENAAWWTRENIDRVETAMDAIVLAAAKEQQTLGKGGDRERAEKKRAKR